MTRVLSPLKTAGLICAGLLFLCSGNLPLAVFFMETFNTTGGINHFLLTGIERMATRANFQVYVFTRGRASFECVATTAANFNFSVGGMNVFLHNILSISERVSLAEKSLLGNRKLKWGSFAEARPILQSWIFNCMILILLSNLANI